jgi:hypothetical protein
MPPENAGGGKRARLSLLRALAPTRLCGAPYRRPSRRQDILGRRSKSPAARCRRFEVSLAPDRAGQVPFLLAECLLMVSAQRLLWRICAECKEPAEIAPEAITEAVPHAMQSGMEWPGEAPTFYRGKGCDRCLGSG